MWPFKYKLLSSDFAVVLIVLLLKVTFTDVNLKTFELVDVIISRCAIRGAPPKRGASPHSIEEPPL